VPSSRAYWKGFLKLSFVSCPIALYPATSAAERLSFRQVNRRTGHRLRHKLVDSVTGETVDSSNKSRGYEVGENEFLLVEDRDIERARSERPPPGAVEVSEPPRRESPPTAFAGLHGQDDEEVAAADDDNDVEEIAPRPRPENTHTIEIERFLPAGQIDARYFEKPYYIVPREQIGQESFAVIRDAMRREGVIGLARVVLSSRERYFLVEPMGNGLRGVTLRFAQEVRGADDYFDEIPEIVAIVVLSGLILSPLWVVAVSADIAVWRFLEERSDSLEHFDPLWKLLYMWEHPYHFPLAAWTAALRR
jgi:DNA end-binding protein Ku